jgi:hypothetical protein
MKDDLAGYRCDGWAQCLGALASLGPQLTALAQPEDQQLRAEFDRFLFSQISSGFLARLYADAEYPDFWPFLHQAYNTFAPNPDATYQMTPITGAGIYRITGYRGTVRVADFQISGGEMYPLGKGAPGDTYANYHLRDLKNVDREGGFSVILSNERPAGYTGEWWALDSRATNIIVRQFAYDWLREHDGRFAIERVDRPAIKPRPSAAAIDESLRELPLWLETWTRASIAWIAKLRTQGLINKLDVHYNNDAGGVTYQKYIEGLFAIEDGEALIYETDMPEHCDYWNVQITDGLWSSIDWMHRQTSLNGHSARIDDDGRLRIVLSAQDPGIPNWLDTAGYRFGAVLGRWTGASSAPTPTLTKVSFADVRKYLPADTPALTPAERDTALRDRRRGAQLRRRW